MIHSSLASGNWHKLSMAEQLGNIGSEISRASKWKARDKKLYLGAVERALELFDLTLQDARWRRRLREICRAREVLCDTVFGSNTYNTSLDDLNRYFTQFAIAARNSGGKPLSSSSPEGRG